MDNGEIRDALLNETQQLSETGRCREPYLKLLDFFGYAKGGKLCVPVYYKKDLEAIREIESVIEACLFEDVKTTSHRFYPPQT